MLEDDDRFQTAGRGFVQLLLLGLGPRIEAVFSCSALRGFKPDVPWVILVCFQIGTSNNNWLNPYKWEYKGIV